MPEANLKEIDHLLKKLKLGLIQNYAVQVYDAHAQLFTIGVSVIPFVESEIFKNRWVEIDDGSKLNLLSGLLRLVHDIDENEAKRIGGVLNEAGCSKLVSQRIISITTSSLSDFVQIEGSSLNVFLSKSLGGPDVIQAYIKKWLAIVPVEDLDKIQQVFVVSESRDNHLGFYVPILRSIQIEWSIPEKKYTPVRWLSILRHQKTLYHEIGHHVHGHTFGQDPEQEKEANRYAFVLMKKDRPVSYTLLGILVRLVKKIEKKLEKMEGSANQT